MMEERTFEEVELEKYEKKNLNNEQGFSFVYYLTMASAVATVGMFVLGTALYLTVVA